VINQFTDAMLIGNDILASHLIEKITTVGVFLKTNECVPFHTKTINISKLLVADRLK